MTRYILLYAALLMTACKDNSRWIPQQNEYRHHWLLSPEAGYELNHVYLDTAGNAWAIGTSGIIRHRAKGGQWVTEDLPVQGVMLFCIGGRGKEVWAAGEDGVILYKKKNRPWVLQKQPAGLVDLRAMYVSSQDVYLAGSWGTILHKTANGEWLQENKNEENVNFVKIKGLPGDLYIIGNPHTILHKTNNTGWKKEACPLVTGSLIDIYAQTGHVYISGDSGLLLHKTASQPWTIEKTPAGGNMLFALYGWDNQIWAAALNGMVLHKAGQSNWTITYQNDSLIFSGMYGRQRDLWITAYNGVILHKHEHEAWQQESAGKKNTLLFDITGNGTDMAAVGLNEAMLHRNGKGRWIAANTLLPPAGLSGVYAQDNEIWVSARDGAILHKKGSDRWRQEQTGTVNFELKNGYRFGDETWLIGKPGVILYKKGRQPWTTQFSNPQNGPLYSIYGYKDELWVVGSNDIVLHKKSGALKWVQDFENKHLNFYTDIIGSADDLWAVGGKGAILHKKINDSLWQQETIDADALRGVANMHLHVIRKQGPDMWAAGSAGTILHKKENQPWKRVPVHAPLADFKYLEADGDNIWAVGNADKKGIVVHKNARDQWHKEEFPGKTLGKILLHKGIFILTATGYLYSPRGSTAFMEKTVTDRFNKKLIGAALVDTTLYLLNEQAIATLRQGEKLYPALRQIRYFRNSWFDRDSLEVQLLIQSPPKGKRKDLRAINVTMTARPFNRLQDAATGFAPVYGRFRIIDTTDNNITLSARFEITKTFKIIPDSDAADKLAVRVYVHSESAGITESFMLYDEAGHPYITIHPLQLHLQPWQRIGAGFLLLYLLPAFFCWRFFPLRFLRLHRSNFFSELAGWPAPLGSIMNVLHKIITLNGLPYSTRVQNAWLRKYHERMCANYLISEITKQKNDYVPLPLRINDPASGELVDKPNEKLLDKIFKPKQTIVQIIGQGGAGKTTLAVVIGRWLTQRAQHLPVNKIQMPVIIEPETTNLVQAITAQLKAQLDEDFIPEQLISAMLEKQRLVVIVDALSERSKETQEYITGIQGQVPANALIITTRQKLPVKVKEDTCLYVSPLNSKNLMHFITADLAHRVNHPVKAWRRQIAFAGKIVQLFEKNNLIAAITPILVKLLIDNALSRVNEHTGFETVMKNFPHYIPQVYYQYLGRVQPINKNAGNFLHDYQVVEVAEVMAKLSLGKNFIPCDFKEWEAQALFMNDPQYKDINPIQRFIDNGIVSRRQSLGSYLRFNLDTLAEYVGASRLYDEHRHDAGKLKALMHTVEQLGPEAAGFKQAFEQVKAYKAMHG